MIDNKRDIEKEKSSFKDPSGFIFYNGGEIYRQINFIYKDNYDFFIASGLYKKLKNKKLIITHREIESCICDSNCYKVIKPNKIFFISYPYEWSFNQLKDAALTALKIQKNALEYGMILKDASAYNIQFHNGRPVLIDTLSFEKYTEGSAWPAYKQFCQHFLGPLALMSYKDIRLNQLFKNYIDGPPLDLISSLLPKKTYLKFPLLTHIHLHSKSQKHFADKSIKNNLYKITKKSLIALTENLESAIKKLERKKTKTEWGKYYSFTNYTEISFNHKKQIIKEALEFINPKKIWDLGGNIGIFSNLAANKGINVISFDIDPAAVDINYIENKKNKNTKILPLILDLTNPSPPIGWNNTERKSFIERGPVDMIMALAIVHHLSISNNIPLEYTADLFQKLCNWLVIEFIPKNDSKVKILLSSRQDIFTEYTKQNFENTFSKYFEILRKDNIKNSERIIYIMKKR